MKLLLASLTLALAACAGAPKSNELAELSSHLSGYFTSAAQAARDKDFFNIELRVVPVWKERADGPWLYVEQAAANTPDKPYRQRVYRLEKQGSTYLSHIYEFKGDPLLQAGQWKQAQPLGALTPADIVLKEGCTVVMQRKADGSGVGSYSGATVEKACPSSLRGSRYGASKVTLDAKLLESWDQGFDETGKQIWGSTKGAYQFVKVSAKP